MTTYGLTETGSGVVYDGRPLDGVEVRIDDDGQILLRGPMLLRAYRDGSNPLVDGWFPTGDLGRRLDDGRLVVDGRRGDLIITGGENVWPEPVEAVLRAQPGIVDVAVAGTPDAEWGHLVTAFVVPDDVGAPTLDALRDAVKAVLAPFCAPRRLVIVDAIPRTALGKVRRPDLLDLTTWPSLRPDGPTGGRRPSRDDAGTVGRSPFGRVASLRQPGRNRPVRRRPDAST